MNDSIFHFDNSYAGLPDILYTKLFPSPVEKPQMIIFNDDLSEAIGLNLSGVSDADKAAIFSGNLLPEGADPLAQAYGGHQYGYFTILGDGRAHLLGEHLSPDNKRWDIQLKGSGQTPYSRRGDGRAALGPMLREYIISEALHALGIPTTRSLAVVSTGEEVFRQIALAGAILTRVARSHIRVGTFEYAAIQQDKKTTEALLTYTIRRHYPELAEGIDPALAFLHAVMEKQADLIVHWMRVGFIHGVMNTDNVAVSGETIDYGPCAFMDTYHPNTVFSSIDHSGRYAYANQAHIVQWNLARFAETLVPFLHDDETKAVKIANEAINGFEALYQQKWLAMMRGKIGLFGNKAEDEKLISDLLDWMQGSQADYTNTFLDLSAPEAPVDQVYQDSQFQNWHLRWQKRIAQNPVPLNASVSLMRRVNPAVIPRNHKVEQALEAAVKGELELLHHLLVAVREPYQDRKSLKPYQLPPDPSERVYQTFCGT